MGVLIPRVERFGVSKIFSVAGGDNQIVPHRHGVNQTVPQRLRLAFDLIQKPQVNHRWTRMDTDTKPQQKTGDSTSGLKKGGFPNPCLSVCIRGKLFLCPIPIVDFRLTGMFQPFPSPRFFGVPHHHQPPKFTQKSGRNLFA